MTTIPQEDPKILEALQAAVREELDRKKRLGHYAVFWRDGKAVAIGEDAPQEDISVKTHNEQITREPNHLHYFCAHDTSNKDALKENEPKRVAL